MIEIISYIIGLVGLLLGAYWYGGKTRENNIEDNKKDKIIDEQNKITAVQPSADRDGAIKRLSDNGRLR